VGASSTVTNWGVGSERGKRGVKRRAEDHKNLLSIGPGILGRKSRFTDKKLQRKGFEMDGGGGERTSKPLCVVLSSSSQKMGRGEKGEKNNTTSIVGISNPGEFATRGGKEYKKRKKGDLFYRPMERERGGLREHGESKVWKQAGKKRKR